MERSELIKLLENRLATNETNREEAVRRGDIAAVNALDIDTTSTKGTLNSLYNQS